jgi:hypothetical protein
VEVSRELDRERRRRGPHFRRTEVERPRLGLDRAVATAVPVAAQHAGRPLVGLPSEEAGYYLLQTAMREIFRGPTDGLPQGVALEPAWSSWDNASRICVLSGILFMT